MPIYEYFCPQCNLKFELLRPLDQSNRTASCPCCHGEADRMVSSFAAASKGAEEGFPPIGGSSSCSTCSALNCAACNR